MQPTTQADELRRILQRLALFLACFAVLWIALWSTQRALPYLRMGHQLIYDDKERLIDSAPLVAPATPRRVFIFGNSKVLAGFLPDAFDRRFGVGCASYNLGLPDATHFIDELERLVARGQVPTHVLLTVPWQDPVRPQPTVWRFIPSDAAVIDTLFPFRELPKDAFIFLDRSRRFGGPTAYYRMGERLVAQMERDRGYYFIEGQSRYPDDRLPEDFRLDSDRADSLPLRRIDTAAASFTRLRALAEGHGLRVLLMPMYYRVGEHGAAPPVNDHAVTALAAWPWIRVLGPDWFSYPNRLFSDPVHLNREGAQVYTADLAALLGDELAADGR